MKAESGWVWAGDEPPGWYSTRTPFMLLPGTLGSAWSKTTVTVAPAGSCAWAVGGGARVARTTAQKARVNISFSSVDVFALVTATPAQARSRRRWPRYADWRPASGTGRPARRRSSAHEHR